MSFTANRWVGAFNFQMTVAAFYFAPREDAADRGGQNARKPGPFGRGNLASQRSETRSHASLCGVSGRGNFGCDSACFLNGTKRNAKDPESSRRGFRSLQGRADQGRSGCPRRVAAKPYKNYGKIPGYETRPTLRYSLPPACIGGCRRKVSRRLAFVVRLLTIRPLNHCHVTSLPQEPAPLRVSL